MSYYRGFGQVNLPFGISLPNAPDTSTPLTTWTPPAGGTAITQAFNLYASQQPQSQDAEIQNIANATLLTAGAPGSGGSGPQLENNLGTWALLAAVLIGSLMVVKL